MADQILQDAVLETTTTQGVIDISLAGAQTGRNAFRDKYVDGDWAAFVIEQRQEDSDGNLTGIDREVVMGKLTYGSPDTISRPHVIESTNAGANVNFGAGTKDVYCAPGSSVFGWNIAGVEERTTAKTLTILHNNLTLLLDATAGGITQALPDGADVFKGYRIGVMKSDASSNAITIDGDGADTVDGAATYVLTSQRHLVWLVWTGTEWLITNAGSVFIPIDELTTGDVKLTYKITADSGWVMADDSSIGNASSGGSNRANADTEDLFTLLWDNISDAECPVSSGRGASAAADFAADKNITIPITLGHAMGIAGDGASTAARTLGDTVGEETHTQTTGEIAATTTTARNGVTSTRGVTHTDGFDPVNTSSMSFGSSTPFNVMQPTTFLNMMIKL